MIGIIGAMEVEVCHLVEQLENKQVEHISSVTFYSGLLHGVPVVVAKCGIGKVFATICAQTMILHFKVSHLINTGVAGAVSHRLKIKDLAIASAVVNHDLDTSALGDPIGLISGPNIIYIEADAKLQNLAIQAARDCAVNYEKGVIASGDQFVNSLERKQWLAETFQAVAVEMEGAAIGQVAYVNKTPFIVLRMISDEANGHSVDSYQAFVKEAAALSSRVAENLVKLLAH